MEICELQYAVPTKVHIAKNFTGSSKKSTKWKPILTFTIDNSETNEKLKDMKFTIVVKYGTKLEERVVCQKATVSVGSNST